MFEKRKAFEEERLLARGEGIGGIPPNPVSAAVIQELDKKLDTIDDLIARLEIEEGEEGFGYVPSDPEDQGQEEVCVEDKGNHNGDNRSEGSYKDGYEEEEE
ncbi:unnamed protein product, partial [Choristocarpus tenellus]